MGQRDMVTSTQNKRPSPSAPSTDTPNATSPTFHANVSSVGADEVYAEISITCQFRDVSDLRDWIVAGTLRLVEDINAKTGRAVG